MDVYFQPLLSSPSRIAQFQRYGTAFEPNPLPAIADALKTVVAPARMLWGSADVHFGVEWAHWLDRTLPTPEGLGWLTARNSSSPKNVPTSLLKKRFSYGLRARRSGFR
jgi:hypothetical protein